MNGMYVNVAEQQDETTSSYNFSKGRSAAVPVQHTRDLLSTPAVYPKSKARPRPRPGLLSLLPFYGVSLS